MSFSLKATPEASRLISHLSPAIKKLIRETIDQLSKNPFVNKKLKNELEGYYSARCGRYRILYYIDEIAKRVVIEYVGHREDVYELFSKFNRSIKH